MPKTRRADGKAKSTRTSVSLRQEDYDEIERIAERKKVSIAWVIRDAVERYLSQQSPLFRSREK
jgi:metal-responsive CopG/Arc/MetJ family transcriptional regulator